MHPGQVVAVLLDVFVAAKRREMLKIAERRETNRMRRFVSMGRRGFGE